MSEVYRELLEQADQCRLVTVNQRLARRLLSEYDRHQTRAGRLAWMRPTILSAEQWLNQLAEQLLPELRFFSAAQEQALWEKVIREMLAHADRTLVQIPATARRAKEAHRLLQQYATGFAAAAAAPDQQVFLQWQAAYQEQLASHGYADRARLVRLLAAAVTAANIASPPLLLVGFDDLKPDLADLLEALKASGCPSSRWEPKRIEPRRRQLCRAVDAEAEVRSAARWARELVAGGAQRIGLVVPELQRYQGLLNTAFAAELDPRTSVDDGAALPFSISLGESLATEGVIAAALTLLALGRDWSLDELSFVLRTPYLELPAAGERLRAELELRLRKKRQLYWPPAQLRKQFRSSEKQGAGQLLYHCFEQLAQWSATARPAAPSDWSQRFLEQLERLGWPGQRGLNSREYQAVEKFRGVLQHLAALDQVLPHLDRGEAVALLRRLCHDETFQPEAPDGKIEVVGLLEDGGLHFEHLWVLGLHDGLLPEPLRPNPFLPYALQRQLRMPHADFGHETAYCQTLADNLFHAAETIVVSYPQQDGERPVRPHHLLRDWPDDYHGAELSHDPLQLIHVARPPLDSCVDDQASAIHSRKVITGGTALLKDQALCPFRAFAHHRLQAAAPEGADVGLDAMMRGTLVHNLLEHFWRHCGNSTTLATLSGADLSRWLGESAESALAAFEKAEKRDLTPRLRQLEQQRLEQLGREWLQLELQRAPFSVLVELLEQSQVVSFGVLQIRTRVDRVDRLGSGKLAIIDYKTGAPDPLQWLDARLTEPQLPVYSRQYAADELGAVLFAVVKSGACRFRGLSEHDDELPGLPEKRLSQLLQEADCDSPAALSRRWQTALQGLADQLSSGWAAVDPIDTSRACRFCDLTTLCRIRELTAGVGAGRGESDAD